MARTLNDIARVLRSKNAGPLYVTFDVIFDTRGELEHVLNSGAVTRQSVAVLYSVSAEEVSIIPYEVVNALKITLPRKIVSGDPRDDDIYGCQQHMKLANMMIPEGNLPC